MRKLSKFFTIIIAVEFISRAYLFFTIPAEYKPIGFFESVKTFLLNGSYVCEFRGQKYLFQKPANTFRIFALGGSATAGIESDQTTWPYKLEKKLNQVKPGGYRYEVINLAQCGDSSAQEYLYLRTNAYLNPDLVIVYDGYNDLIQSNASAANYIMVSKKTYEILSRKFSLFTVGSWLYRYSAIFNRLNTYAYKFKNIINEVIIRNKWFGLGEQSRIRVFDNIQRYAAHYEVIKELDEVRHQEGKEPSRADKVEFDLGDHKIYADTEAIAGLDREKDLFPEVYEYNLQNIAKFLNSRNARGLFVFQAYLAEKMQRRDGFIESKQLLGLSNFQIEEFRHFLKQNENRKAIAANVALQSQVNFFDAQKVFDNAENKSVYLDVCHNSDAGLEILAQSILDFMKTHPLLLGNSNDIVKKL